MGENAAEKNGQSPAKEDIERVSGGMGHAQAAYAGGVLAAVPEGGGAGLGEQIDEQGDGEHRPSHDEVGFGVLQRLGPVLEIVQDLGFGGNLIVGLSLFGGFAFLDLPLDVADVDFAFTHGFKLRVNL